MKRPQAYSKRVGAGGGWLKLLLISLALILSCRKSITPPPPHQQYDPRNISRTEGNSYVPSITVTSDGTIHVVWKDSTEGNLEIYYRYKRPGENWSEIKNLSCTETQSWGPKIVSDPYGNIHLVWEEHRGGMQILYRVRTPDGEWSDVENISWPLTGWNEQPRIAVDSSGVVHVIWINGFSMKYRQKPPGGDWSSIEPVPVGSQGAENPNMCADAEGGAHIVYEGVGIEDIYYLYRSPSGGWSEPVNVSESQWYSWIPSVSVSGNGRVWVNWVEMGQRKMSYVYKDEGGEWVGPVDVPGVVGYPWTNVIKFSREGELYYVWQEFREGQYDVYMRSYSGEDWGYEENGTCQEFCVGHFKYSPFVGYPRI